MRIQDKVVTQLWPVTSHYHLPTILVVVALCLLSGCGTVDKLIGRSKTPLKTIQVIAEVNANQNTATAIDIVFVYNKSAIDLLPKTGPEWFEKKSALLSSMASNIEVVSLQVPPATLVTASLPKKYKKAIGVYAFVNYLTAAGQATGNLTPYKDMVIWLTPTTVLYKGK